MRLYEHSESIARGRRLFVSSDEEEHQSETPVAEHSEHSASSHARSRSRNRNPATESEDSLSLLQRHAQVKKSITTISSTSDSNLDHSCQHGRLAPHVIDRWCGVVDMSERCKDQAHPQVLQLADCLPPPTWIRMPTHEIEFLHSQLRHLDMGPTNGFDQVVKWHEATLQHLETTPLWSWEVPLSYCFYTDGSSIKCETGRKGTAAVILIVHTDQGPRWGGSKCFQVSDRPTAPKTEIVALLIALLWSVQIGEQHPHHLHPLSLYFGYDCMLAGQVAAGQWKIRAHHDLQTHGRALALWIEQKFHTQICWEHLPSHNGHPWNEAADALSWAAVQEWIQAPAADDILSQLDTPSCLASSWLWMLEASWQQDVNAPHFDNHNFLLNARKPHETLPDPSLQTLVVRQQTESPELARTSIQVSLRFATANVLTLYDHDRSGRAFISARQEAIMDQFFAQGIHFAGIQETRSSIDGHRSTDNYHVISSPSTSKGSGGIQLWAARRFLFPHRTLKLDTSDLKILHATAQRLIVRVNASWLRCLICVCHAPASGTFDCGFGILALYIQCYPEKVCALASYLLV